MPAPDDPITQLACALAATPMLQAIRCPVLPFACNIPHTGSPPRIVIYPTVGPFSDPLKNADALIDVNQRMIGRCWAESGAAAWDLQRRLLQALELQAAAGGVFRDEEQSSWDTNPDTCKDGQEIAVTFSVRLGIAATSSDIGHTGASWPQGEVDAVNIQPESP